MLVKLAPGATEKDLRRLAGGLGGSIRRKLRVPGAGRYLVALGRSDADALPDAIAALTKERAVVALAEPDRLLYHAPPGSPILPPS